MLGALAPVHTFVSSILIVPFVGLVSGDPVFAPSEAEIAEVLAYPLDELTAAETTVEWPKDGHVYRGFAYPMRDGNTVWGATAGILHQLLERLGSRHVTGDDGTYVPSDQELRSILGDARTIAVVGLSSNPERPSYEVAEFLQAKGYRIVPVNPNETEVLGERAYASLLEVPEEIADRRRRRVPPRGAHARGRRAGRRARREGAVAAGGHRERRRAPDRRGRRPRGRSWACASEAASQSGCDPTEG